ncbi:MAG: hypothetical protein ACOCXI_07405 [Chloroflexota bacterium]
MLQFPTIFDWIERLEMLRGLPAAYLALLTAFLIVVVWDWRVTVLALAVQYFAAGLLFVDVIDPRLAVVKLLVGWFICLMLYFTARQVNWGRLPDDLTPEEAALLRPQEPQVQIGRFQLSRSALVRLLLALAVTVAILLLGQRAAYRLPAVPATLNLAIYALGGLGLLGLSQTTEPLKAGAGLLTFMTGFELFYNTLEQSAAMLVFLAAGNLALTLVISYLTQVRHTVPSIVTPGPAEEQLVARTTGADAGGAGPAETDSGGAVN